MIVPNSVNNQDGDHRTKLGAKPTKGDRPIFLFYFRKGPIPLGLHHSLILTIDTPRWLTGLLYWQSILHADWWDFFFDNRYSTLIDGTSLLTIDTPRWFRDFFLFIDGTSLMPGFFFSIDVPRWYSTLMPGLQFSTIFDTSDGTPSNF